jgi:hypothetical protein
MNDDNLAHVFTFGVLFGDFFLYECAKVGHFAFFDIDLLPVGS